MKAVILVGGYGTRLRPLTLSCPKPLVEFGNKPMIVHQIEALEEVGCDEVVLAIAYKPEVMRNFLEEWQPRLGVKITLSEESEPLGTAGPLALARNILREGGDEPFFVLNSDVICTYPLRDLLEFHRSRGAEATLLTTKVEDPSKYGVVVMQRDGKVNCFVEKPKSFVGDKINAGIYIMNQEVLQRIELKPTSIEREIFPAIAADNRLFGMVLRGHWMDLGQPVDFLKGLNMHLDHLRIHSSHQLADGDNFRGNVLVAPDVEIGENCMIGPDVSISEGCTIGNGVRLSHCCVMRGSNIQDFAYCKQSIIGWNSGIGKWCRLENNTILGENVNCKDEVHLNGAIVLPHKSLSESVLEPKIIL
ncbi:hypothetical protein BSKO_08549 [Bryopsis sp. KO-2023]|nr:hypothetical protein BSKO_08549 [Bryopsis sp. KO-2023]